MTEPRINTQLLLAEPPPSVHEVASVCTAARHVDSHWDMARDLANKVHAVAAALEMSGQSKVASTLYEALNEYATRRGALIEKVCADLCAANRRMGS